jgi:hypothetical protein
LERKVARQIARLTNDKVNAASTRGLYADGGGLYLLVGPTGAKSWVFRYRINGKLRDMGLGPTHTVGLAEARKRAQQHRLARLDGIDPLEIKAAKRTEARLKVARAMTFKACTDGYMAANRAGWGTRHAAIWEQSVVDHAYPVLGDLPVQAVDTALLMRAIEPLWNTKTETASRVRGRVEAIIDYATAMGWRSGPNPAVWRGGLKPLLPAKSDCAQRHAPGQPRGRGDPGHRRGDLWLGRRPYAIERNIYQHHIPVHRSRFDWDEPWDMPAIAVRCAELPQQFERRTLDASVPKRLRQRARSIAQCAGRNAGQRHLIVYWFDDMEPGDLRRWRSVGLQRFQPRATVQLVYLQFP